MIARRAHAANPPLQSRYAADPEMAELIDLFLKELPEKVEALRAAAAVREATHLRRLAHQLKGAAAMYGFPTLGTAAASLESRLDAADADEAQGAMDRIGRELDELIELCDRAWRGRH